MEKIKAGHVLISLITTFVVIGVWVGNISAKVDENCKHSKRITTVSGKTLALKKEFYKYKEDHMNFHINGNTSMIEKLNQIQKSQVAIKKDVEYIKKDIDRERSRK